jgi:hypothetical protein
VVEALIPKILNCQQNFTSQNVANAFYGLQNMRDSHKSVDKLVKALIPKVEACKEPFRGQTISAIMFGMRCMKSKSNYIRFDGMTYRYHA